MEYQVSGTIKLCIIKVGWIGYRALVLGAVTEGYSAVEQGLFNKQLPQCFSEFEEEQYCSECDRQEVCNRLSHIHSHCLVAM